MAQAKRVSPGATVKDCTFTRTVTINGDVLEVLYECAAACGSIAGAIHELTRAANDSETAMLVIGDTEDKA